MESKFNLESNDSLTLLIKREEICNWQDLANVVKHLPYGRNKNRKDFNLVWTEQKGTCSSKHAFLKHIADLSALPDIELILAMYKMNATNTPKTKRILSKYHLDYIPEAHCYLKLNEERLDCTSPTSDFKKIETDIFLKSVSND